MARRKPKKGAEIAVAAPPVVAEGWGKLGELHPRRFFLDTWKRIDREAAAERAARAEAGLGYDHRPLIALVTGATFLTLMEYWGSSRTFRDLIDAFQIDVTQNEFWETWGPESSHTGKSLMDFAWWAGWRVLGYALLPMLVLKLSGQKIRDHGLETKGFSEHAWIYGFFYCIVLVLVVIVSFFGDFSDYYPFYKLADRSWADFFFWELMYAAQFFSLEFFFRGFWLRALKTAMGSYAIFAMTVPYCMIHYGKPFLEALAAIIAGIVLGTLAMKTRSIWSGFLIHVSVAVSMDVAALLQTSDLPTTFWPH
jgi:membrane protease YdiL (CAAX protease family)